MFEGPLGTKDQLSIPETFFPGFGTHGSGEKEQYPRSPPIPGLRGAGKGELGRGAEDDRWEFGAFRNVAL